MTGCSLFWREVANELEIREKQKDKLFDFLVLLKLNEGNKIKGLNRMISKAKALMSKEDIADVEKLVAELEDE